MAMNRRNVLVGLGAVAVGGGAAFGSGAFSQVEAERTINVQTAGDSSAFLSLDPSVSGFASSTNGTVQFDLDSTGGTSNGNGLNFNATTTIDPIIDAANEGSNNIGLYVTSSDTGVSLTTNGAGEQVLRVNVNTDGGSGGDAGTLDLKFIDSGSNSIVDDGTTSPPHVDINSGISESLGVIIDTTNVDTTAGDQSLYSVAISTLTITAESGLN